MFPLNLGIVITAHDREDVTIPYEIKTNTGRFPRVKTGISPILPIQRVIPINHKWLREEH